MNLSLKPLKSNQTEIETEKYRVLFSYETPVACYVKETCKYYRTEQKWSVTTSKHINQWLAGEDAERKPQEFFDNLV